MENLPPWMNDYKSAMSFLNDFNPQQLLLGTVVVTIIFIRAIGMWFKEKSVLFCVPGYPFIGNLTTFMPSKDVFKNISTAVLKHGSLLEMWVFNHRIIVVADVATARECMMKRPKTFRRTAAIEVSGSVFGFNTKNGTFFSEGEAWARQRRLTSPAFSHKNVELMACSVSEEIDAFIARLKAIEVGQVVNMNHEIFFYTIRVISSVAFGNLPPESYEYFFSSLLINDVSNMFAFMIDRLLFPLPAWMWAYSPKFYTETNARVADKRFSANCMNVIIKAREAAASNNISSSEPVARKCLLENLIGTRLGNESPLTDIELLSNVKIFFLAGSDTTSVVITWCVYNLCMNKGVREAVQKEVDGVLSADVKGAEAIAAIPNLPLCAACFKESLRLQGPVEDIILGLTGNEAVTLSNGIVIQPGNEVFVHIDSVMMDPKVFVDPTTFNPYRWLTEHNSPERLKEMDDAYLAFGHGPRVCPGQALANVEGIAALAALARCFDMKLACPADEIKRVCDFVTKANKMPIFITPRP